MNLARIQQHQREALNYRIQRGTMSIKLLSVKTGISQSHLCLFLHGRKRLSLDAMDKVLVAQGLAVEVLPIRDAATAVRAGTAPSAVAPSRPARTGLVCGGAKDPPIVPARSDSERP